MPSPIPRQDRWTHSLVPSIDCGLPHDSEGSALALVVSGPAQRLLTLRPACSPSRQGDPLHRRLQQFRFLHYCSDCYRVERTSSRAGLIPAVDQRLHGARNPFLKDEKRHSAKISVFLFFGCLRLHRFLAFYNSLHIADCSLRHSAITLRTIRVQGITMARSCLLNQSSAAHAFLLALKLTLCMLGFRAQVRIDAPGGDRK